MLRSTERSSHSGSSWDANCGVSVSELPGLSFPSVVGFRFLLVAGGAALLAHDSKFALAPFSHRILRSCSIAFSSLLFAV